MGEELDFTRSGVIKIYERMLAGEMTEEDFHRACENTEKILSENGSDIKVRYMGGISRPLRTSENPYPNLSRVMGVTFTFEKPKPEQTKLFEEDMKDV